MNDLDKILYIAARAIVEIFEPKIALSNGAKERATMSVPRHCGKPMLVSQFCKEGEKLPISLSRNLSYGAEIVDLDGPVPLNKEDDSDFFHGHTFRIVK